MKIIKFLTTVDSDEMEYYCKHYNVVEYLMTWEIVYGVIVYGLWITFIFFI